MELSFGFWLFLLFEFSFATGLGLAFVVVATVSTVLGSPYVSGMSKVGSNSQPIVFGALKNIAHLLRHLHRNAINGNVT